MIFIIQGFLTIVCIFIVISTTFPRRSLMIFIIQGFRSIVFIFIVISTTFRPICPPAFFRYLSNSGTVTALEGVTKRTEHHSYSIGIYLQEQRMVTRT